VNSNDGDDLSEFELFSSLQRASYELMSRQASHNNPVEITQLELEEEEEGIMGAEDGAELMEEVEEQEGYSTFPVRIDSRLSTISLLSESSSYVYSVLTFSIAQLLLRLRRHLPGSAGFARYPDTNIFVKLQKTLSRMILI
jgi:hypothetical protein